MIYIEAGGTGIVEMLFCTSLVALVGAGEHPAFSPRQLQIINTKVIKIAAPAKTMRAVVLNFALFFFQRQTTICELSFPTAILAVKMNRRRLIVVLEEQIFLYDISNMKLLHTIDTNPNPQGNTINLLVYINCLLI